MSAKKKKSVTDRYSKKSSGTAAEIIGRAKTDQEEYKPYGSVADNTGQEIMLEFRQMTGNRKAIGYSYLLGLDFNPSKGIDIEFVGHKVVIMGKHLDDLFRRLIAHKVSHIQEIDELHARASLPEETPIITSIKTERV